MDPGCWCLIAFAGPGVTFAILFTPTETMVRHSCSQQQIQTNPSVSQDPSALTVVPKCSGLLHTWAVLLCVTEHAHCVSFLTQRLMVFATTPRTARPVSTWPENTSGRFMCFPTVTVSSRVLKAPRCFYLMTSFLNCDFKQSQSPAWCRGPVARQTPTSKFGVLDHCKSDV